jgi:DNA repair exonuclease SbcCD nuclease subunit
MKIAVCADVHLGNHRKFARGTMVNGMNRRARETLRVFEDAMMVAAKLDCGHFNVVGDLIDNVHPTPQLLARVMGSIEDSMARRDLIHTLLVGNHDQASATPGDHALGVFATIGRVVDRPWVVTSTTVDQYFIPYRSDVDGEHLIKQALSDIELTWDAGAAARRVLFVHLGIEDGRTPVWLRGAHDSIHVDKLHEICVTAGFAAVFAGNWHDHRRWVFDDGVEIVQCGALVPTGFNNLSTPLQIADPPGDPYGSLITWDSEKPAGQRTERFVMNGPRFVKTKSTADARDAINDGLANGHIPYVQIEVSPDAVAEVNRVLVDELLVNPDDPYFFEVVADRADVQRRIEDAALSAKDAETTDRAIREWVEKMPAGEGIDRARVYKLVKEAMR